MSNKVLITNEQNAVKVPSGLRILIRRSCNAVLEYENFDGPAEISVTFVDNARIHELNKQYPEEMYHFNRRVDLWHVEGGETAQDVLDRYLPALHRVGAAHDGGTVAVFSHGAALRIVLGVYKDDQKVIDALERIRDALLAYPRK